MQVACFIVCTIAHAAAFVRWRLRNKKGREQDWQHFGWFTGTSCVGSIAGALAYGARIGHLQNVYASRKVELLGNLTSTQSAQVQTLRSYELWFCAAHFIIFPLELGCVVISNLLLLSRMQRFALVNSTRQRFWILCARVFSAAVILCILIGVFGNIGAGVFFVRAADLHSASATAWAANDLATGRSLQLQAAATMQTAAKTSSVERFSEMIIMLLLVAAFCIVGIQSFRIVATAIRALVNAGKQLTNVSASTAADQQYQFDRSLKMVAVASEKGKLLQTKVVCTFCVAFLTCLVRSSFTVFYGLALYNQNSGDPCSSSPCHPCKNMWGNINFWILYTPALQQVVYRHHHHHHHHHYHHNNSSTGCGAHLVALRAPCGVMGHVKRA